MQPRDTSTDALAVQRIAGLGRARRVALAFEMSEQAREISILGD